MVRRRYARAVLGAIALAAFTNSPADGAVPDAGWPAHGDALIDGARQGPCLIQESGYTLGWPLLLKAHGKDPDAQRVTDIQDGSNFISVGFIIKNTSTRAVNPEYTATLRDGDDRILAWVIRSQGDGVPIYYIPPGGSAIVGSTTRFAPEVTQAELDAAPGVHLDVEVQCPAHTRAYERFFIKKDMSAYEIANETGSWGNVPAVTRPLKTLPEHATFVGTVEQIPCDEGTASGCWDGRYDWNYRVSGNFTNPGGYRKWNGTPMVIFRDQTGRIIGGDSMGTESLRCRTAVNANGVSACRDLAPGDSMAWEFETGVKDLPWDWGAALPTVQGSVQPVWGAAGDTLSCPARKVQRC